MRGWTRTALLSLAAIKEAIQQSGIEHQSPRVGLISATTASGIDKSEPMHARNLEEDPPDEVRQYIGQHA